MSAIFQNLVWEDFLLAAFSLAIIALAYIDFRHIKHPGFKRVFGLLLGTGLVLAFSWAGYRYYDTQKRIEQITSEVNAAYASVSSAETNQQLERDAQKLRQAFADVDDAMRELLGGTPTYRVRTPVEDYSDSAELVSARSKLSDAQASAAALSSPWEAARQALLVLMGILVLLLAAYWPIQWSLAGFRPTEDEANDEYEGKVD